MKHILILITSFRHGGTNKSLQNLSSIIDKKKFSIDVFTMEHYGPYLTNIPNCNILKPDNWVEALIARFDDTKGIARIRSIIIKIIHSLCKHFGFDITNFLFKRAARRLSNNNYDVAVAFSEGVPALFVSHLNVTNKIAWVHCDYSSYMKLNNHPDETAMYESFNSVVCVSEYTRKEFCRHIPSMRKSTYTIYNILNTQLMFSAARDSIPDTFYTKDQFNIVSIGGINIVKRFSKIPQIVRLLIDRGCSFRWYLIGQSTQPAEQAELEFNIKKYDVSDYFFWLGPKDNPYPYIAQSDLLVNTSISEAAPYVVNEAKILHTPVVCTNFGSAPEFIEDGFNGFITPIEQIVDKIELLIKNKQEYNKIKKNISGFVYNNEQILKQVYNLLQ